MKLRLLPLCSFLSVIISLAPTLSAQEASPAPSPLSIQEEKGLTVVAISQKLDAVTSPLLQDAVKRSLEAGSKSLVIDLEACPAIDDIGVSALLTCHFSLAKAGGSLCLRHLQGQNYETLAQLEMLDYFELLDSAPLKP